MAKLEKMLYDDFNRIIGKIEAEILSGSSSASLEDTSDFVDGDARCSVRVFERYSACGGNRVSLSVTLFQTGNGPLHLSAIPAASPAAMIITACC